jgi:hypothetical protein
MVKQWPSNSRMTGPIECTSLITCIASSMGVLDGNNITFYNHCSRRSAMVNIMFRTPQYFTSEQAFEFFCKEANMLSCPCKPSPVNQPSMRFPIWDTQVFCLTIHRIMFPLRHSILCITLSRITLTVYLSNSDLTKLSHIYH